MRTRVLNWVGLFALGCALVTTPSLAAGRKKPAGSVRRPKGPKSVDLPTKSAIDPISEPNAGSVPGQPAAAANGGPPPSRGPTRLDFDDRLIQGQTNKSGAVYLYDRKELKNRSMIKKRESFRSEIIGAVYDSE